MQTENNPLLIPFDLAPFSQIKNEHFLPAFKQLIEETKKEIDTITKSNSIATFENTVEALEYSGQQLDRVSSVFFNLNSGVSTPFASSTICSHTPSLFSRSYLKSAT